MTSRYSRKVVQRQSIPASIAAPEISSARSRFRTTRARPDFELGAKVKPQLPMTAVVTPCQHDEDPKGSQCIWASRWVCPSLKHGVTTWPSASITCLELPETSPIAAKRPPGTAKYAL